jgi:hypothetical protein
MLVSELIMPVTSVTACTVPTCMALTKINPPIRMVVKSALKSDFLFTTHSSK